MVPNEAVKEGDDGSYVQVMQPARRWIPRKVTVGLAGNDNTEIIDGLKEGERVVTAIVQPKKATTPPPRQPRAAVWAASSGGMRMR